MRVLGPKTDAARPAADPISAPPSATPVRAPPVRSGWTQTLRRAALSTSALLLALASGAGGAPAADAAQLGAHGTENVRGVPVTALSDSDDVARFDVLSSGAAARPTQRDLRNMVYDMSDGAGGLAPEAWRAFRDTALAHPPSREDVRAIRVSLDVNNGKMFSAAAQARVVAFLEHPSPEMRAAGHAAGDTLDVAAARAQVELAGQLGAPALTRGALSASLRAFALEPDAQAILTEALGAHDRRAVVAEALDGALTLDRWLDEVAPNLVDLPHTWSETADEVLRVRFARADALPDDLRRSMDTFLRSRGYPMNTPRAQTYASVRAGNMTTPDAHFEALMDRAGRDGRLIVGVADGGFDLGTRPLQGRHAPNTDEIPNNDVDDDGDGYVDNYNGINLVGMVDGQPLFGRPARGELRTGIAKLDHHGNHVSGVATRGTDRLSAATASTSSGLLAEAFDYLAKEGATVINFSMGVTPASLEATLAAIDRHPDVLFVHAAGNDSTDVTDAAPEMNGINREPRPNLVHVAAAGEDGARLSSSNYSREFVGLAAPAKHFSFSLSDMTDNQRFEAGMYYYGGQTSQASPNAGNTLAKMRLLAPDLTPAQAIRLAQTTSAPDARWTDLVASGGVVDPEPAMTAAALYGLVQDGATLEDAAAQLRLDAAAATQAKASLQQAGLL